jgi:hypothetical protein
MSTEDLVAQISTQRRRDHGSRVRPASTGLPLSFSALIQHVSQDVVVAIFVYMVHAHVSVQTSADLLPFLAFAACIPLKIVRSRISVFALWTEWTDIAWAIVHQTMADHLILALEAFAAF